MKFCILVYKYIFSHTVKRNYAYAPKIYFYWMISSKKKKQQKKKKKKKPLPPPPPPPQKKKKKKKTWFRETSWFLLLAIPTVHTNVFLGVANRTEQNKTLLD